MADPTADAPAVDEFAQTRGGDDLFDDEIIPVSTEEQVQPETQPQEGTVDKPDEVALSPPTQPRPRSRGGERGRGRGRWRGRGGRKVSKNRRADGGAKDNKLVENTTEAESANVEDSETGQVPEKEDEAGSESKGPAASNGEGQRVPAVRGDRSATGGIKKPKLTEEELSQRIAAAKENAAKLSAAHARAEADQASFLEREKQAEAKRREERQNRRVMDSERERNRQRKLDALNGREWDATKQEEDYNPRSGKSQFRRGMHGGVSGYARRDFDDGHSREDHSQNGYGYRGRGRGRGGRSRAYSRGPRRDSTPHDEPATKDISTPPEVPVVNNESDFPALPSGPKDRPDKTKPSPEVKTESAEKPEKALSPVSGGASWADQVESQ